MTPEQLQLSSFHSFTGDLTITPSKTLKSYAPLPLNFFGFVLGFIWFDLAKDHEMEKQPCLVVCRVNFLFCFFCFLSQKKQQTKKGAY